MTESTRASRGLATDPYERRRACVDGTEIAYVDTGKGKPVVFLHGNPTSSYLWRNIIPHVEPYARCLAPDLVGFGNSGSAPDGSYRFVDHRRYLDAWFDAMGLTENVTLVVHDWGSGLGFDWARRHQGAVAAIVYLEAIVHPLSWQEWPESAREIFQAMRTDDGEHMVLDNNVFVEQILPTSMQRELSAEEMAIYRRPFNEAGETRRPTLTWPRELPINGTPSDVVEIINAYARWLEQANVAKLFVNGDPGMILTGDQREYCRSWPNQREVTLPGAHFLQEDAPRQLGTAIADFVRA